MQGDPASALHPPVEVVPLVQGDAGAPATEANWTTTIGLIRAVAERTRALQSAAHAMAHDASETLSSVRAEAAAAKQRAKDVRAEADAARERADRAERKIELLTRDLVAAGERIVDAERRAAEATAWLKRIHDRMTDEFDTLTITSLPPVRT